MIYYEVKKKTSIGPFKDLGNAKNPPSWASTLQTVSSPSVEKVYGGKRRPYHKYWTRSTELKVKLVHICEKSLAHDREKVLFSEKTIIFLFLTLHML